MSTRLSADPELRGLDARSLTEELQPWQVEHDTLLLADGSYVIGFACDPLATDGMSDDDLVVLARRAKAWLHALPDGEGLRIVYDIGPGSGAEDVVNAHGESTEDLTGPLRRWRDLRLAARRRESRLGETLGVRLLVFVSYHPPRLRPPNRWGVAALVAGVIGVVMGVLAGWRWGSGVGLAPCTPHLPWPLRPSGGGGR